MSLLKYIVIGSSLVVLSTAAFAFQEQKSGSAPAPAQAPVEAAKSVDLASPSTPGLKPTVGTEVRIPGLGKLGSLPKMDFGLELLYGAAEAKQPDAQTREEPRDDLTIRGSVKHRF
ncbi:MAG: hypothetical protein ABL901_14260 [Hyphomicrobiaceae bacterium]